LLIKRIFMEALSRAEADALISLGQTLDQQRAQRSSPPEGYVPGTNFDYDSTREIVELSRITGVPASEVLRKNAAESPPRPDYSAL
jgi:hypothetical protein